MFDMLSVEKEVNRSYGAGGLLWTRRGYVDPWVRVTAKVRRADVFVFEVSLLTTVPVSIKQKNQ